jgi:hypothetical protein
MAFFHSRLRNPESQRPVKSRFSHAAGIAEGRKLIDAVIQFTFVFDGFGACFQINIKRLSSFQFYIWHFMISFYGMNVTRLQFQIILHSRFSCNFV